MQDCFDCFRLAPDRCDRHARAARMTNCWDCGDSLPMAEGKQFADHMYCIDCYDLAVEGTYPSSCEAEAEYDTPSLQDTDPEGYRYITNNRGAGY